ncbi:MAG: type II toxin-antitoxin system prevent-host-death family antitoxin [Steroidobacteraceae bacterium]
MRKVNIHEAKTRLSQLVEAVEAGEEIVLARAGRPVARLARLEPRRCVRFGLLKGKFTRVARDFDRPLSAAQMKKLFGGSLEP